MFFSKKLSRFKNLKHCFFSRKGGFSKGIYKSLNCGRGSKDKKRVVLKNIKYVSKKIDNAFACRMIFFVVAFYVGLWTIRIPTIKDQVGVDYLGIGYILASFSLGSVLLMILSNKIINYYGMVEQTGSIFFECDKGYFHTSIYSDIIIRKNDLTVSSTNEEGV